MLDWQQYANSIKPANGFLQIFCLEWPRSRGLYSF